MFSITINNTTLDAHLDKMVKGVEDMREPFDKAGLDLRAYFGTRVFEQGGNAGKPWAPLSPATLLMRKEHFGYYAKPAVDEGKTLVWTGNLRSGFWHDATKDSLKVYNTKRYFPTHQLGLNGVPKREILVVDTTVVQIIMDSIQKYLSTLV